MQGDLVINIVSVYFHTGIGVAGANLALIDKLVHFTHECGTMWMAVGDFNAEAQAYEEAGVMAALMGGDGSTERSDMWKSHIGFRDRVHYPGPVHHQD